MLLVGLLRQLSLSLFYLFYILCKFLVRISSVQLFHGCFIFPEFDLHFLSPPPYLSSFFIVPLGFLAPPYADPSTTMVMYSHFSLHCLSLCCRAYIIISTFPLKAFVICSSFNTCSNSVLQHGILLVVFFLALELHTECNNTISWYELHVCVVGDSYVVSPYHHAVCMRSLVSISVGGQVFVIQPC